MQALRPPQRGIKDGILAEQIEVVRAHSKT
jgi:hypothetical protein